MHQRKAILYLENGACFEGSCFGAPSEALGEVVFNTSMTGYQEVLTDPSYAGQIVIMTQPQMGNYGTNDEDEESRKPFVEGFVVRECSRRFSNWRGNASLTAYLERYGIAGVSDIDTRAAVRLIRQKGAMRGILSARDFDRESLHRKVLAHPGMTGSDYVRVVSTSEQYSWGERNAGYQVVAYDFGVKTSILRCLTARGCHVTVVPAHTPGEDVLALRPDGIFLSNGPGDPAPIAYAAENIRRLLGRKPIFGICLGHQLLALALGGKTYKLKFGHRGSNQPVKNLITNKVEITSHNHGFAVDPDSLKESEIQLTHVNLNDQTLEGLRHRYLPVYSVQYHPEASPGPHDSRYLFDEFVQMMAENKGG